jgi:hypothetical protein
MDIMKSIVADHMVPFRTREIQGAVPTLAPISVPVQGITVSAAGQTAALRGAGFRADAAFVPTTGVPSVASSASPL